MYEAGATQIKRLIASIGIFCQKNILLELIGRKPMENKYIGNNTQTSTFKRAYEMISMNLFARFAAFT